MEKTIGKEYANLAQREAFLKDNCTKVEKKGYMKPFTPEQLQGHKENLAEISINIEQIETEKKQTVKEFGELLKPLLEQRKEMCSNIRQKAEYVDELCFKFVDQEARQTGFYNAEGDLIELRPATADELQPTLFSIARNTGTN